MAQVALPATMGALGAFSNYKQAKKANKPKRTTSSSESYLDPYAGTEDYIQQILSGASDLFDQGPLTSYDRPPPNFKVGDQTQAIINQLSQNALGGGDSRIMDFIVGQLGQESVNPYQADAYEAMKNFNPSYMDDFIQRVTPDGDMGGMLNNPYLDAFLQQRMGQEGQGSPTGYGSDPSRGYGSDTSGGYGWQPQPQQSDRPAMPGQLPGMPGHFAPSRVSLKPGQSIHEAQSSAQSNDSTMKTYGVDADQFEQMMRGQSPESAAQLMQQLRQQAGTLPADAAPPAERTGGGLMAPNSQGISPMAVPGAGPTPSAPSAGAAQSPPPGGSAPQVPGGALATNDPAPGMGQVTNTWMRDALDGAWLNQDAPGLQSVLDRIRREGLETYQNSIVPQIDSAMNRAGRFGSNAYATAQGQANAATQQSIGDQIGATLFQNYNAERNRMADALGQLNQLDQTRLSTDTQRDIAEMNASASASAAGAAARAQKDALALQRELAQEDNLLRAIGMFGQTQQAGAGMGLDAIQSLMGGDLSALGMMGDMAGLYQQGMGMDRDYTLGLLGAAGNLGAQQNQALMGALGANQWADTGMNDARNNRWNFANQSHMFNQQAPWDLLAGFGDIILPIAAQFGTQHTSGENIQPGAGVNPWLAGLQGGIGGAMMGRGMSGMFGGGGPGGPMSPGQPTGGGLGGFFGGPG